MKFNLIATATFGIEAIVGRELKSLGFEDVVVENGRVLFTGNERDICRANMWLRTADRVFIQVAEFKATTFETLFNRVNEIPWENYLPFDAEFPVNAKSVKSKLFSLSDIQSISKKAIVKRLGTLYNKDWLPETGAKYSILVGILKDTVTVSIDTSGVGLHKRGYREQGHHAPLKETLAASLINISRWQGKIPLIDPMCGTGTIAIEAALIGRNIAPGLNRKFDFEQWSIIPDDVFKAVKKEAYEKIDYDAPLHIEAYDKDPRAIKIARENAEIAGVEEDIHFQVRDVKDLSSSKKYGYIITNPPYGERLNELEEVQELTRVMSNRFEMLDTWSKYVFTAFEDFEKFYNKKSTKNRKLYNGKLKCYFYQYFGPRPPRKKD
ncbi:class I SAM-dependent RNA methyltransferase [Acidaminobacter sp. JC074]|uniref:THUMP domain-containing class I SAM-dependent RNA methyltransferase n=1 Tax=Acidaminobacter sp. JC074 TaxID=2530199 RepID=UPI001F107F48|nr:class I SAM-dependent RNA methyltransferase [Acidaminobacter sp. JC074]